MIVRHDDSPIRSKMRAATESATLWLVLGNTVAQRPAQTMTDASDTLPDDIDALRALILAERAAYAAVVSERNAITAERDKLAARNERLAAIIKEIRRANLYGERSG
jgi:hypothetical protein